MSFNLITMLVRWVVTAQGGTYTLLDDLAKIPMVERKRDERVQYIVQFLKEKWLNGTKIEKMATLGWNEYETICIFCDIVENLAKLREQYAQEMLLYGGPPPELSDADLEKYEEVANQSSRISGKKN